ncbi:MAG TPA: adenylate/guanylate cyclase domain-containing protein [Candidatus Limnocylindrales bacterium]|nr:adenylate/guanylate cyclase domain-containing protein [Candidatus Limnocylindrales bacterium]
MTGAARLTIDELALRAGSSVERVERLVQAAVLPTSTDERYDPGHVHLVRLVEAFQAAGVPLAALTAAAAQGRVSFASYHELHGPIGPASPRTYAAFVRSLGDRARELPALHRAFGLAEPAPESHLALSDERLVIDWLERIAATGAPDLALRALHVYAEGIRRASEAALGAYAEGLARVAPDLTEASREEVDRYIGPWSAIARAVPELATWLVSRHLSSAIDAFSVATTERVLEELGFVPRRAPDAPAIAFVDLTGFTRLSQQLGDEAAARMSLALGDLARAAAERRAGRVVKLLGDGVLLRFTSADDAVRATLDLLAALPGAGLPTGHAGIHAGSIVERDGDVFGRSVNLAARLSDAAPDGEVYVSGAVSDALGAQDDVALEAIGEVSLEGIGQVSVLRVLRR